MILILIIGCVGKAITVPKPTWYKEHAYQDPNGHFCACGHHDFNGNLNLSTSSSTHRARQKLTIALAEQMMPYVHHLETTFELNITAVSWSPEIRHESVFQIPFASDTRHIEFLPDQQNPVVLWSEVCVTSSMSDLMDSLNQRLVEQHNQQYIDSDIEMKITSSAEQLSFEEQLDAIKQNFIQTTL